MTDPELDGGEGDGGRGGRTARVSYRGGRRRGEGMDDDCEVEAGMLFARQWSFTEWVRSSGKLAWYS
jgi:hypothetical protein